MLGSQGLLGNPISKRGSTVPRTHVFLQAVLRAHSFRRKGVLFAAFENSQEAWQGAVMWWEFISVLPASALGLLSAGRFSASRESLPWGATLVM